VITEQDLKLLAEQRLEEAQLLLKAGRHSGAYYLAGYSVELGLKACIARSFRPNTIPTKAFVNAVHTHDLTKLVGLAGLTTQFDSAKQNATFAARWGVVSNWDEGSRYEIHDVIAATALIASCHEVLQWIRQYW
jgi:HEPN domain-containing protein